MRALRVSANMVFLAAFVAVMPSAAYGQASITGVVRDSSAGEIWVSNHE